MKDISLKEMMNNAVHFGHRTQRWNPKMKKFLFAKRNGIHIFDLHQTAQKLKEALEFIAKASSEGRNILLVGTKQQATSLLVDVAKKSNMPVVTQKWICGLLTNFSTIKQRIKYMKKIKELFESGEIDKYTKKEQLKLKKQLDKLDLSLGGVADMTKKPDILFVVDSMKDKIAIQEAKRLNIKVVAIVDSCSDPDPVDYIIPANDDALKSLTYIIGLVGDAIMEGKAGKKKDRV